MKFMIDFLLCFTFSHLQITKFRTELVLEHSNMDTESKFNQNFMMPVRTGGTQKDTRKSRKTKIVIINLMKLSFSLNCHFRSAFLAEGYSIMSVF